MSAGTAPTTVVASRAIAAQPAAKGGIEQNLGLLARTGLAMFLALGATLFFVQFMLGRQLQNMEHNALQRQRVLDTVQGSVGALFKRQAQILSSTAGEQLKVLADRSAIETVLRQSSAQLAAGSAGSVTVTMKGDVDWVLQADQQLFDSIKRRHELQGTFEKELSEVSAQLRATTEQTHGILGLAHLDFIRVLRRLNINPGDATLVREVVLGDRRAQQELASDLVTQMLTLGVLVGKIGLAPTTDVVNSIMANEIAQNITATRDKLEQLTALVARAPEISTRATTLRKTYEATIPRIASEDNPTSMVSLRRAWFGQHKRAESLRQTSVEVARELTANVDAIQREVMGEGEHAVIRADRTIWFTRALSVLLLVGGLGICVFAARRIRASVDDLRQSHHTLEDLKEKLVAINGNLEGLVADRTRALGECERQMRLVLDNTGDGLIAAGLDGTIKGEVSLAARQWIGEPMSGQSVWSYLFAGDTSMATQFEMGFGQLAEDVLPFDVSADLMPARFERNGRIVQLGYKEIREGETFVGVLVALKDVTAQLEAERREEEAREMQALVGHILRSPQGFRNFLDEGDKLIEVLVGGMADLVVAKRALHTMKGNCAVYGIRSLANLCHDVEDQVEETGVYAVAQGLRLKTAWQQALSKVAVYIERDESLVELGREDIEALKEMLQERAEHNRILEVVHSWSSEPLPSVLVRLAAQVRRIAPTLGKEVEVATESDMVRPPRSFAPFLASLVHVVRNAVDHGVESPEDREAAGKSRAGRVRLLARRKPDARLEIEVVDDGAGLDFRKVKERALRMNLPHATEQDLMLAVFTDGLSTRDAVTETSGRGVGLGAVRASCEALGGKIRIRSGPTGTSFLFAFPATALSWAPGPATSRDPATLAVKAS